MAHERVPLEAVLAEVLTARAFDRWLREQIGAEPGRRMPAVWLLEYLREQLRPQLLAGYDPLRVGLRHRDGTVSFQWAGQEQVFGLPSWAAMLVGSTSRALYAVPADVLRARLFRFLHGWEEAW